MAKILLGVSVSFCAHFLKGQVAFLNKKGAEVVIISGPGEEISLLAKKENAKLYTIPFARAITPIQDIRDLIRVVQIIKKENPDIIHAGNPKSGLLIMLACWLVGHHPRIFTLHGLVSDSRTGFSKWLIRITEKITCSIADKVLVVSQSLLQHAVNEKIVATSKSLVIGEGSCNGVNLDVFRRSPMVLQEAAKIKLETMLPDNVPVIGFVGRLSKDKGIDLLLEAFNLLRHKYTNLKLIIAGPLEKENPISKKNVHQLYEDPAIIYLGKMHDVAPVYCLMDILVLSSYREGFGNVLIEAAAMEVPVVAPDIPGCRDAVKDGFNGTLFKKGDIADLYRVMDAYLMDTPKRKAHGAYGLPFVESHFSQQRIWEGQWHIYEELLMKQ